MPRENAKVQVNIRLSPELLDRLKDTAERYGQTQADIVTRGIEAEIDRIQSDLGAGFVWVVLDRSGISKAVLDEDHARRTAEAVNGVLARFPVVADYRENGEWGGEGGLRAPQRDHRHRRRLGDARADGRPPARC